MEDGLKFVCMEILHFSERGGGGSRRAKMQRVQQADSLKNRKPADKNEVVTVSGMACGIDSAAHLGALGRAERP